MRLRFHRLGVLLAAGALVAPLTALAVQASSTQQAATNAYFDCLVRAAQDADDHASAPSALALKIEPSCTGLEAQEQARFRATLSPGSAGRFDRLWPDVRQSTAVKAVLISRGAPMLDAKP